MKKLRKDIFTPTDLNNNLLLRLSQNDSSLKRLIFCSRNLGKQGVKRLVLALETNNQLSGLDLSSNRIGVEGARCLASILAFQARNMSATGNEGGIKTLILGDNDIRDDGVEAIARALEFNPVLESLWVDDNCIGASGLEVMAKSLKRNSKLERLHLKHNSFQSLSSLVHCTFDKQSIDAVANSNHTLKHVFLDCGYSYQSAELETVLKINRLGKFEARRKKIAVYLEEDLGRLFELDMNYGLLPSILEILGQNVTMTTVFRVIKNLPSEVLFCKRSEEAIFNHDDDAMDFEYL